MIVKGNALQDGNISQPGNLVNRWKKIGTTMVSHYVIDTRSTNRDTANIGPLVAGIYSCPTWISLFPQKGRAFMKFPAIVLALAWVLGSWKGYVALFTPGAAEPRQIFPTAVASLPEEDRAALEQGILLRSQRALEQALEDYLS